MLADRLAYDPLALDGHALSIWLAVDRYGDLGEVEVPRWYELAECEDEPLEVFFPENATGNPADWARALELCERCPVRQPCRDYADLLDLREGVWGGATPRQRARERSQRAAAARERREAA